MRVKNRRTKKGGVLGTRLGVRVANWLLVVAKKQHFLDLHVHNWGVVKLLDIGLHPSFDK